MSRLQEYAISFLSFVIIIIIFIYFYFLYPSTNYQCEYSPQSKPEVPSTTLGVQNISNLTDKNIVPYVQKVEQTIIDQQTLSAEAAKEDQITINKLNEKLRYLSKRYFIVQREKDNLDTEYKAEIEKLKEELSKYTTKYDKTCWFFDSSVCIFFFSVYSLVSGSFIFLIFSKLTIATIATIYWLQQEYQPTVDQSDKLQTCNCTPSVVDGTPSVVDGTPSVVGGTKVTTECNCKEMNNLCKSLTEHNTQIHEQAYNHLVEQNEHLKLMCEQMDKYINPKLTETKYPDSDTDIEEFLTWTERKKPETVDDLIMFD